MQAITPDREVLLCMSLPLSIESSIGCNWYPVRKWAARLSSSKKIALVCSNRCHPVLILIENCPGSFTLHYHVLPV